MAGDRSALVGLLLFVLVAAVPTVTFWLALRVVPRVVEAVVERRAARRPPSPGPSLERVVADVRRLHREIRAGRASSRVRQVALLAAYDDALLTACTVVGVSDPPLAGAAERDRAFARLLTEAALEQAGVSLDPPSGGARAA